MRTTLLVLAATVIVFALLAACRTRDEPVADTTDDSARADGTATDSGASAPDTVAASPAPQRKNASRTRTPDIPQGEESPRDSMLPPEDSIRAMRPDLPQVTPEKRPRTWRGFKLPEERPVRVPLEPIRSTEEPPDSAAPPTPPPPKPRR